MLRKNSIPLKDGFNIWFNREKRKEFYTSSVILYKAIINHDHNNRFPNIILESKEKNKEIYYTSSNFIEPFEENYGSLLIKFVNADFSNFESSYCTFFCFYGFSILTEFSKNIPKPRLYKTKNDFYKTYEPIFIKIKPKIRELQRLIKNCINYMYNLNKNSKDSSYSPFEKYLTYVISNNMFKYSTNLEVFYFQLFAYDTLNIASQSITPKLVKEHLKNEIINIQDSAIFHTKYLSNLLYVSLAEIASNNNISIKSCKNCGKYFIPIKKIEKYCDIVYYKDAITCKQIGANNSYLKKRNSIEAIKVYRNNYQRRLMQVNRTQDEQVKQEFINWKLNANLKIKEFNHNKITEKELLEWMINNKNL